MSQPAQCVILWITIFVATLKHRGKKGEAELRVWVSEAQDGGTDTKKKRIKSKTCLYRKQIINRTSHHAKKKEEKKPHRNLVSSLSRQTGTTPGQRLQPHKLSHRHWSAWVCLNTHTGIFTNLDHPQHQTLSPCTQSVSFHRALLICNWCCLIPNS